MRINNQLAALPRLSNGRIRSAIDRMDRLKLSHRPTFRANHLNPALEAGLIERPIPDKPNSRLQQYRLTSKGRITKGQQI